MNIEDGVILSIDELINEKYLPVGISRSNMNKTTANIIKWWAGRRIPASRINAFDIGSDNIRDIIGRDDLSYLPENGLCEKISVKIINRRKMTLPQSRRSSRGMILITNKTIDKKSSHNPYTQDYAMIFCIVFNWCLV